MPIIQRTKYNNMVLIVGKIIINVQGHNKDKTIKIYLNNKYFYYFLIKFFSRENLQLKLDSGTDTFTFIAIIYHVIVLICEFHQARINILVYLKLKIKLLLIIITNKSFKLIMLKKR